MPDKNRNNSRSSSRRFFRSPSAPRVRQVTLAEARRDSVGREPSVVNFYRSKETGEHLAVRVRGLLLEVACLMRRDQEIFVCHMHGLDPDTWGDLEYVSPSKVPGDEARMFYRALLGEDDERSEDISF